MATCIGQGDHAWTCLKSNCCQSVLVISEEWRRVLDRGTMHGPVYGVTVVSLFFYQSLRNGDVHLTGVPYMDLSKE